MPTVYLICPIHRYMLNRWSRVFGSRSLSNCFITWDFQVTFSCGFEPRPMNRLTLWLVMRYLWSSKCIGWRKVLRDKIKSHTKTTKLEQDVLLFSGTVTISSVDLKFGLFWILNGRKEVGLQMVQLSNEIWNLEAQPFEILTNGRHLVKHHLKSDKNF